MNDGDFETYDPRDPYGYAAEDELYLCSGPLPDDSEGEPKESPLAA